MNPIDTMKQELTALKIRSRTLTVHKRIRAACATEKRINYKIAELQSRIEQLRVE